MLTILRRGRRELVTIDPAGPDLPSDAIWLDLLEPTPEEIAFVGRSLGIELPTREEMREIEASARVYEEGGALYFTATMLVNADGRRPSHERDHLRLKDGPPGHPALRRPPAVPQHAGRGSSASGAGLGSGLAVFFWLVDADRGAGGRRARAGGSFDIDTLSREIFGAADQPGEPSASAPISSEAIERIGRNGDTAARDRECLLTLLAHPARPSPPPTACRRPLRKEARLRVKAIQRDIASLSDHCHLPRQQDRASCSTRRWA